MDREKLIQELNELSENEQQNKQRMLEIAKILVADYYGYTKNKDLHLTKDNGSSEKA